MGRLAVPLINEPVPLDDKADLVALPSAEGGRPPADEVDEVFDVVLGASDFADCDFTGV